MIRWFGLLHTSGELISFKMCVIVHDNPHELAWLITGAKVVGLRGDTPYGVANGLGRRVMLLRDHPDLSNVRWPLAKNDFWDPKERDLSPEQVRRAVWQSTSLT